MPVTVAYQKWYGTLLRREITVAAEEALHNAAVVGVRLAKKLVPKRTGRLRASIKVTPFEYKGDVTSVDIVADAKPRRGGIVSYARSVEEGSRGRPAKPFIKPGGMKAEQILPRELRAALKKHK